MGSSADQFLYPSCISNPLEPGRMCVHPVKIGVRRVTCYESRNLEMLHSQWRHTDKIRNFWNCERSHGTAIANWFWQKCSKFWYFRVIDMPFKPKLEESALGLVKTSSGTEPRNEINSTAVRGAVASDNEIEANCACVTKSYPCGQKAATVWISCTYIVPTTLHAYMFICLNARLINLYVT